MCYQEQSATFRMSEQKVNFSTENHQKNMTTSQSENRNLQSSDVKIGKSNSAVINVKTTKYLHI